MSEPTDCPSLIEKLVTLKTILLGNTTQTSNGTILSLECVSGYVLKGPPVLSCDGGVWRPAVPICQGIIQTSTLETTRDLTKGSSNQAKGQVTEEPPSEWRLNLTRVDVIVLGVCCALLLFLLILSIIVCIIYKRKTINKYMHKKHHHVNHHHHHHTSSDASTSQSEDERPIWTAQNGPSSDKRRHTMDLPNPRWSGILPSYYPAYFSSYPNINAANPMMPAPIEYPMMYYHWQPSGEGRPSTMPRENIAISDFGESAVSIGPAFYTTKDKKPFLRAHGPLEEGQWDTRNAQWQDSYDFNRLSIPRAHLRSTTESDVTNVVRGKRPTANGQQSRAYIKKDDDIQF